jgi:aquaporin Z
MKKSIAEFIGTFTLVLVGCGTAAVAGEQVGFLGIAFAFGLAIVAMAYGIGPISGCHVNPAVSFGAWMAGRMSTGDLINYAISQCLGAIAGAAVLYLIMSGKGSEWNGALGANGWGPTYLGGYNVVSAFVFEAVATFIFLVTILGVTQKGAPSHLAGLAIGLTLAAIHIFGINITGVSVNPARSLGPAIFEGTLGTMWLFIIAPLLGAGVAGLLFRSGILSADEPEARPGVSAAKAAVAR